MIELKLEETNKICIDNGLNQLKMSKVLTWVDKSNTEGIEIQKDKIVSFWVRDFQRVYGEIPSEKIQKVVREIDGVNNNTETKQEPPKEAQDNNEEIIQNDTQHNSKITVINQLPSVLSGKRIIVSQDIEELKQMSTFERMLLFQRTNPAHIKTKPKGKNTVSYVEGNFMQVEANVAFLFRWSDKIDGFHFSDTAVACYGSVSAEIDGEMITHSAVGVDLQEHKRDSKEPIFALEELMKNAHMDMIKKALSKFGFNNDVYRGDV